MNTDSSWLNEPFFVIALTLLIGTLFFVIGSQLVATFIKKLVSHARAHETKKDVGKRQNTLSHLFVNIWRSLVIAITTLSVFSVLFPDVSLAPMFASAGILGVAFGFGAQSLVKDFLSGVFIISENQYRVGDVIEIEGFGGTVERIGTRSTVIRDIDGHVHYFPNGMIQHVINKTMGYGVARLTIGIAPGVDLDEVIELINTTGLALAEEEKWKHKIIEPPHFVVVSEFTASNVELVISGKTQPSDQWSVASELRRRLFELFEDKKIALGTTPYPTIESKK